MRLPDQMFADEVWLVDVLAGSALNEATTVELCVTVAGPATV